MTEMLRRRAAVGITVAAVVSIAVAAFLPWARTGQASRSAFALARTADELGVVRGAGARVLFVGLALLPAAAAATWIAAIMGWRRWVATLGIVSGSLALVGASEVWRAPVEAGAGVVFGAGTGVVAVVSAVAIVVFERKT
jgi:hypothetical protein